MVKSGFGTKGDVSSAPCINFVRKMIWGGIDAVTFRSHSDNDGYESVNGRHSILNSLIPSQLESWPKSVEGRWQRVLRPKSRNELALLSWNTNGRLALRGCRESLIRSWARKGYVDLALIQETLKKNGSSLFDLFGSDWWNISSWAVGGYGRGSGGCSIFGQPSLVSLKSCMIKGGRICGSFIGDGLVLNIYFPTKSGGKSMDAYRSEFSSFVDELISEVSTLVGGVSEVSWLICGTDTNAHFIGSGSPPRMSDDWAALEVRRFMKKFSLASLTEKFCPSLPTRINSRGHKSCLDTFLVSNELLLSGAVTMFEVVDWIETGSDHCPLYLRVRVFPQWTKRRKLPERRILKSSGLKSLGKKLGNTFCRKLVVSDIKNAFYSLDWSKAVDQKGMNSFWAIWVELLNALVDKLIGTRLARQTSWGRKFDPKVRALCKQASISRSWYLITNIADGTNGPLFRRWVRDRKAFINAWEKSKREWLTATVTNAVKRGDIAIWKLLGGKSRGSSRPLVKDDGSILTDPSLIANELSNFHQRSLKEISCISAGEFDHVKWDEDFIMKDSPEGDLVLDISDELVVANVKKMKLSSVPDQILPIVVKLFFGHLDTVGPLADLIRAVVRTRSFPRGGKIARQIFLWKGKGEKNSLENCRTITLAGAILKICEACVKQAGMKYWKRAGFPCAYWGQFSGAPESIYIWVSTVECYIRNGLRPETALTDVSKAVHEKVG